MKNSKLTKFYWVETIEIKLQNPNLPNRFERRKKYRKRVRNKSEFTKH